MLKIYLARHGQDEDNQEGVLNGHRNRPLSELGRSQAKKMASYIKDSGLSFDKIYSSPLKRAYETASEVAKTLALAEPEVLPLLIERNFGILTGQNISDIERLYAPNILKTETVVYALCPEGAESFPELIERAKELLKLIKIKHQNGNILLVGHGDFGKMVYAAYYNINWLEVLSSFHFGNSELILLAEGITPDEAQVFKAIQHNA